MFCKKCGKEIPDSTNFCTYCGAVLKNPEENDGAQKTEKNMKPFIMVCAGAVVVMMAATGVFMSMKKDKEPKAEETMAVAQETSVAETTAEETTQAVMTTAETVAEPATEAVTEPLKYVTYFVANCNESITLRTEPVTSAAEIVQIPYGASVSYVETSENGFYKIIYNGKTGYALASYLSETRPQPKSYVTAAPKNISYTTYYVVNCDEWISLRETPSTSASRIASIPLGEPVSFIESASNGFYKISYNGLTGYALASYLSSSKPYIKAGYYVANCNEWISLRVSPDTKSARLKEVPLGAYVEVLETGVGNGFWKIRYDGVTGYALSQYITWKNGSN